MDTQDNRTQIQNSKPKGKEEDVETVEEKEKRLSATMVHWAESNEKIRALALCGEAVNRAAVKKHFPLYEWYLAVAGDFHLDHVVWKTIFGETPILAGGFSQGLRKEDRIRLAFEGGVRFNLTFYDPTYLSPALEEESLHRLLVDKDQQMTEQQEPTDLSHRCKRPDEGQCQLWCSRFFSSVMDAVISLHRGEVLSSQLFLENARQPLLEISKAATAFDADFRLNLGDHGENLSAYMDEVCYDHLLRSFAFSEVARIWDAIFQACMLFRKSGLKLDQAGIFSYPRRTDVELLRLFRGFWEEERGGK